MKRILLVGLLALIGLTIFVINPVVREVEVRRECANGSVDSRFSHYCLRVVKKERLLIFPFNTEREIRISSNASIENTFIKYDIVKVEEKKAPISIANPELKDITWEGEYIILDFGRYTIKYYLGYSPG